MTVEAFYRMLERQSGECAICGVFMQRRGSGFAADGLVVDHDHKTGQARALLCNDCNVGIARLGEQPNRMREAARYIEAYAK